MTRLTFVAGVLLATLTPALAQADTWSRTGPGGTVTRSYDPASGWSVSRQGAGGVTTTATANCVGRGFACQRNYAVTGPRGRTATGTRLRPPMPLGQRIIAGARAVPRLVGPVRAVRAARAARWHR